MSVADRPEVQVASMPLAFTAVAGLAANVTTALAGLPFRRPFDGPETPLRNLGTWYRTPIATSYLGRCR